MTVNVNIIENDLYTKVCESFSEYAEKRLERYKSLLEFLRITKVEIIVGETTGEVYEHYYDFCTVNGYEPLAHTIFSRTVCECGFSTYHQIRTIKGKRKKFIYFCMQ